MSDIAGNMVELATVANTVLPPVAAGLNGVGETYDSEAAVVGRVTTQLTECAAFLARVLDSSTGIGAAENSLLDSQARIKNAAGQVSGTIRNETQRAGNTVVSHATGIGPLTEAANALMGTFFREATVAGCGQAYNQVIASQVPRLREIRWEIEERARALQDVIKELTSAPGTLKKGQADAELSRDIISATGQKISNYVASPGGG